MVFQLMRLCRLFVPAVVAIGMLCHHAQAATIQPDTISTRFESRSLILPGALTAAGAMAAALPWWRKHIDRPVDTHIGSHSSWRVADGIEWLPYAAAIAAAYCGADATAPIADRALLAATSFVVLEAITQPTKRIVRRWRPDGSDRHSFPSGHTATAFAGAELTRMLYGPIWGAGAYVVATGVAAMRMAGRHHYLSDCIAGAGIGIFSARAAAWLLPLERRLFHLDRRDSRGYEGHTAKSVAELSLLPVLTADGASATLLMTF